MEAYIKIGGQFSGVGAFDFALDRLGIKYENVYQAEWDKYARQTYLHNHSEPEYYVKDVNDTPIKEITDKHGSLDIAMFSPPCQSFSLAGKRGGESDKRGTLFYNSHEFIVKNKPRYFIFENVKGLLSDDGGKTFQRWIDHLGGKSVNGNQVIFPIDEAVPYHVYHKVLNAKNYGVPQNRERIFIIGIRDDADNNFSFPKPFHLVKRLKDVLESEVDEKYYLSDKMINGFVSHANRQKEKGNGFRFEINNILKESKCITTCEGSRGYNNFIQDSGYINQDTQASQVHSKYSEAPTLSAGTHGYANGYVIATDEVMLIKSRRTEVAKQNRKESMANGKGDTGNFSDREFFPLKQDYSDTILANANPQKEGLICIAAMRGRNPENNSDRTTGAPTQQTLEINRKGTSNAITTVQKDNLVICKQINPSKESGGKQPFQHNRIYQGDITLTLDTECGRPNYVVGIAVHPLSKKLEFNGFKDGNSPALLATDYKAPKCIQYSNHKIRRLTPRECANLMDFPKTFTWKVSDSQIYKQMGNSIVVNVLAEILKKLNL